jgi:hypothetical protein
MIAKRLHAIWQRRGFLCVAIACAVIGPGYPPVVRAMDWETAAEVAFCRNRAGYERDAGSVLDILKAHEIYGKIIYFKRINGVDAVMEDTSQADKFGVFVNAKNAGPARKILAEEIKKGLRITLSAGGTLKQSNE